jgi:hypothetical protein
MSRKYMPWPRRAGQEAGFISMTTVNNENMFAGGQKGHQARAA